MSEVNKIRVLGKDYLIKTRRRVGINQVTNLSGIPVDREKIIATLSGAADFSFSEPLEPGDLLEIICTASEGTEEFVQDFTGPGITTNFDDLTMISPGKVVIAKIYCYDDGKYYIVGEGTEKAVFKYKTGDIIVYDNKVKRLIPISPEVHNFLDYPTSRYAPVGVVVIPSSHNVYGNGAAGVVCLTPMSTLTPSTGASEGNDIEEMCWGDVVNVEELPEMNVFNHLGNTTEIKNSIQGVSESASLAIDYSVGGIQNPLDTHTIYLQPNEYHAPSPYDSNSGENPLYSQTNSPGSVLNALSDFHGYFNTKEILKKRGDKNYESWKPTKTVGSDYPAASCCDMYKTEGTKQGDWYLPGAGEIGYLMARKKTIDASLVKLGKYSINVEKGIWTSTESGESVSINVDSVKGMIGSLNKDSSTSHVYSFIQLSEDGKVMDPDNIGNISTILFINNLNFSVELSKDGISYEKLKEGNNIVYGKIGEKLFYKFYKSGYESQEGVISVDSSFKYINVELSPVLYSISFNIKIPDVLINYSIDNKNYNNTYINGEEIKVPHGSILYWRSSKENYHTREEYIGPILNDEILEVILISSVGNTGDIALYSQKDNLIGFCPNTDILLYNNNPQSYYPVGICVIPTNHNVYENNSAGVVGLNEVKSNFGGGQTDFPLVDYYNSVYIGDGESSVGDGSPQGVYSTTSLPSDLFVDGIRSLDSLSYYGSGVGQWAKLAPSPYNSDKSRNSYYYDNSQGSNSLSDFNGKLNTENLIDFFSSSSIPSNVLDFCTNYRTEGTKQGDWYIPSMGELGYLAVRCNLINESIIKLNEVFFSDSSLPLISTQSGVGYYSSTEKESYEMCSIVFGSNNVASAGKAKWISDSNYSRVFIRI